MQFMWNPRASLHSVEMLKAKLKSSSPKASSLKKLESHFIKLGIFINRSCLSVPIIWGNKLEKGKKNITCWSAHPSLWIIINEYWVSYTYGMSAAYAYIYSPKLGRCQRLPWAQQFQIMPSCRLTDSTARHIPTSSSAAGLIIIWC
jgi:hypothetical protein